MAKRMHVVLEDDVDGSEASETITFAVDGVAYEIDLNAEHAGQFREAVGPWVGHARRSSGRRGAGSKKTLHGPSATEIRAWAVEQGMQVSSRGRVSQEVREAYEQAH